MKAEHNIKPIYNKDSKIIILGSFPSIKSREGEFFYNHPQNRFWKVIAAVMNCNTPVSIDEKKKFLLENKIAVWDVIKSCEITNSSDSSIKNATPNDISIILNCAQINAIFTNGNKAYSLYNKLIKPNIKKAAIPLPSTSPANAKFKSEQLKNSWLIIKDYIF